MGIKKLVTITVEAQIEIELSDWANNPTQEDIDGVNSCGFDVENSDDIYKQAALTVLMGYADCNNDVFGQIYSSWRKGTSGVSENSSFYEINSLDVEHCDVVAIGNQSCEE